jgi:hypothetical protein
LKKEEARRKKEEGRSFEIGRDSGPNSKGTTCRGRGIPPEEADR